MRTSIERMTTMVRASARAGCWLAAALPALAGCGIGVARDLSAQSPSAVVYDDTCKLQDYFDAMSTGPLLAPPLEVAGQDLERADSTKPAGGKTKLAFRTDFQLKNLRRVLRENWKRLPPEVLTARELFIEVRWSQRAGVRRVVTTQDAELSTKDKSWSLPYHVCLSDFLFGSALYRTRREMLGLPALPPSSIAHATPARPPAPATPGVPTPGVSAAAPSSAAPSTTPLPVVPPPAQPVAPPAPAARP
jgi:hypothetical protein